MTIKKISAEIENFGQWGLSTFCNVGSWFLVHPVVPGSSRVEDALSDTIPPAPPVLRSLFNLVPADAQLQTNPTALRSNVGNYY